MMRTILVVEDTAIIGALITHTISNNTPHFVILVNDGLEALEVTQDIKPDLFLLDYLLPTMNGIELYDQLHARKELQDIPAIILSTLVDEPDVREAIEKRHLRCMEKPLQFPEFLQLVEELLLPEFLQLVEELLPNTGEQLAQ
jgi:CheY-like chemotaxis protein